MQVIKYLAVRLNVRRTHNLFTNNIQIETQNTTHILQWQPTFSNFSIPTDKSYPDNSVSTNEKKLQDMKLLVHL